ncbi:MAG: hypothetical protein EU533_03350 [Promethearchaeota archaeon]|nr:MAG: hypothetical protein EU533_03350 [Candidatus Lokiarchaeota archaeon]
MTLKNKFNLENWIGIHTLIYGETYTQKTYLTAKFVDYLIEIRNIKPKEISILDFAPEMIFIDNLKIGGKIADFSDYSSKCRIIESNGEIIAPRLKACNKRELYENICHNYKITSKSLKIFNENPTKLLIMNDISIYLHLGDKNYLLNTIQKVNTFLGNSYYGSTIKTGFGCLLSLKEKKRVEFLIKNLDNSILTG